MHVVVTGKAGQLARALSSLSDSKVRFQCIGRPELDLSKPETVKSALVALRPQAIVNAAAWTAVDKAETERDMAFRINRDGAGAVAEAAAELDIPLVQISTDYVFSGGASNPYVEDDLTGPQSVYGASKLAGEAAVREATMRHAILRTAWLYSPWGQNFVKTMMVAADTKDEVSVVNDQLGSPTSAQDLAQAVRATLLAMREDEIIGGIFHAAGGGEATWYDLAEAIFKFRKSHGLRVPVLKAIASTDWVTSAPRPRNSRLDSDRLARVVHYQFPEWPRSLKAVLEQLVQTGAPKSGSAA